MVPVKREGKAAQTIIPLMEAEPSPRLSHQLLVVAEGKMLLGYLAGEVEFLQKGSVYNTRGQGILLFKTMK